MPVGMPLLDFRISFDIGEMFLGVLLALESLIQQHIVFTLDLNMTDIKDFSNHKVLEEITNVSLIGVVEYNLKKANVEKIMKFGLKQNHHHPQQALPLCQQ